MEPNLLHRFEVGGQCFAMDTETCFCFECDRISWDVLTYYPREPINRIYHLLKDKHPRKELEEVVGELEWLRVTKAILVPRGDQEFLEQVTRRGGLQRLTLVMDGAAEGAERAAEAGRLLLARSGEEKVLTFSLCFRETVARDWNPLAGVLDALRRTALLAGKILKVELDIPFQPLPGALAEMKDHDFRCRAVPGSDADLAAFMKAVMTLPAGKPKAAVDALEKKHAPESIRVMARPGSANFHRFVETLHKAGYTDIVLDMPGAWAMHPGLDPETVADALQANAAYYADQLLRNSLFRVEPLASLFNAIHMGTPNYRADKSGVESMAVDVDDCIYPSPAFVGNQDFVLGRLAGGGLDEARREPFLLTGALQVPECLRCWARGLCGGGHMAIHLARTGNIRTPDEAWCNAQRRYIGAAVATFNRISSAGINFSHLVSAMRPRTRHLSLFSVAKALFQGYFGVRPLREDDASMLVRWENWNRAAYFVCNDTGALMATLYDREMDALHPLEFLQELVLTRRDGTPCGLVKLCPYLEKRIAVAWLYLRDPELYAKSALRTTLRQLLAEVCRGKQLRHVLIPVTKKETALAEALLAAGFTHAGTQREALYQQGAYQDVDVYKYSAEA